MNIIKKRGGLSLIAKFMFGLGIILLYVIALLSFLTYDYQKKMFIKEAYEKTDIVLAYIDATMEYARDELRPEVFRALPGNVFLQKVMSSSFMNMLIMKRFKQKFPNYIYRRVAIDPMNPADKANAFEEGYIRQFQNAPDSMQQWKGLITRNGEEYFVQLKPVVMEKECLLCHGDPSSSPESITANYGKIHGRHWKVGEVVGLESIAVPMSGTLTQLRHAALYFFLIRVAVMVMFFIILNAFHYWVAILPMKRMNSFFKDVVNGKMDLDIHSDTKDYYELSELAASFNRMIEHLKICDVEKNRMWERVLQTDKLASIGQLAAGVAHEINNPLSLILGYTKLLRKECNSGEAVKEDIDVIYDNARLCKTIVEDLLNFSRQTKANLVPTDLNVSIDTAVASLEETFKTGEISITREYDKSLPYLSADEDKMKRIFMNLLMNSAQATKPGGSITIRTEHDREGNGIRIIMTDTGSGIPEEIMNRIFEPFFTTKPPGQGTGLGLAVTYGMVKEQKGEISVKSKEGEGTSVTLWFPLNENKA